MATRKPFDHAAEQAKRAAALFQVKAWKAWNPTVFKLFVWRDDTRKVGSFVPNGAAPDGRLVHVGSGPKTFRTVQDAHAFRLQMPADRQALTSIIRETSEVER